MNPFEATTVMISLFLVRLAVPLVLTLLFGLLMNRLFGQRFIEQVQTKSNQALAHFTRATTTRAHYRLSLWQPAEIHTSAGCLLFYDPVGPVQAFETRCCWHSTPLLSSTILFCMTYVTNNPRYLSLLQDHCFPYDTVGEIGRSPFK